MNATVRVSLISVVCTLTASYAYAAGDEKDAAPAAKSARSNYVGDCFMLNGVMPTTLHAANNQPGHVASDGALLVLAQEEQNSDKLTVVEAQPSLSNFFQCRAKAIDSAHFIEKQTVSAADLLGSGAQRTGWTYGVLVLPYKYHFDDKSFSSAATIGPYIGRRSTLFAASLTWAVSAGLTPISVSSTSASGAQQSTTLNAFTYAAGFIFEINKGASPMRAGIFVGRDRISSDSAVQYVHDRKNWLALQIGYDFTDN